ncbi:MAG: tetratricopeptide repeat protein [Acidobacteriota bacterium]
MKPLPRARTVLLRRVVAFCAWVAIAASPGIAFAQRSIFVEGLSELTAAVAGTYGDEGARIGPALDKMAGGLAGLDRAIQAFESRLASELPAAQPGLALQMHVALGEMYVERARFADAIREFEAASRLAPDRADLPMRRGLLFAASGKSRDAGAAFRAAWILDPGDPIKAYHVFRHAASIGNIQDMRDAREILAGAYLALRQNGAGAKASRFVSLELLDDRDAGAPALAPLAYRQGYARLALGDYAGAIAEFRRAAAIDPLVTDPAARSPAMALAVAALRQGRLADARSLLAAATARQDSSEAHRVLGLIDWADAADDKSIEQLEIAIRVNPRDERSRLALAQVLTSAGRDEDAERALRETLRLLPDSALAHWWLGRSDERLNRFAEARQEFEIAAAAAVAGRSQFQASIGRLAGAAADVPGAISSFARSVSARPNDPLAHKSLAGALLQEDRADEAFVELVAALLIDPLDADAHAAVGQIHLDAGRYAEAVTALRRALDLSADHAGARYALATALLRSGHPQEAAPEFARFEQAQRLMQANRRRGLVLDVMREEAAWHAAAGRHDRAASLWQQVVDREPGRPSNHLGLAEALANAGRVSEAARARAIYEKALQAEGASRGPAR